MNLETGEPDKNQNELMNVYFGVTEYWELNKLLQISKNYEQSMKLKKEQKLFKKNH